MTKNNNDQEQKSKKQTTKQQTNDHQQQDNNIGYRKVAKLMTSLFSLGPPEHCPARGWQTAATKA